MNTKELIELESEVLYEVEGGEIDADSSIGLTIGNIFTQVKELIIS